VRKKKQENSQEINKTHKIKKEENVGKVWLSGRRMLYYSIRKRDMESSFRRSRMRSQAKTSVKNVIDGRGQFIDVVTIVQNQMINEYPGLMDDPETTAEVIVMMATHN
jgi:hypothetical protein|tara:strand:- start:5 stop:328 length:324 start_codon:yes stop_codon:yes gene_type:complete